MVALQAGVLLLSLVYATAYLRDRFMKARVRFATPQPACSNPPSSTALGLSYTGTYRSRRWSDEENDYLLSLRAEHLNPSTGRVRRGDWQIICGKLSAMMGERIDVKVAQHQADNVMRRRRGEKPRPPRPSEEYQIHKWSEEENEILMAVRSQFLDSNGRVMMGAWANITAIVSEQLSFPVTISQASKRAKDIERKQHRRRIERGTSALEFVTTLDTNLVEAILSGEDQGKDDTTTLYKTRMAPPSKKVTKDIFRAWTLEDTKSLLSAVEEEEERIAKDGRGGSQKHRPRGFWVDIADRLNRCPTQCRNRWYWLRKIDTPLFGSE